MTPFHRGERTMTKTETNWLSMLYDLQSVAQKHLAQTTTLTCEATGSPRQSFFRACCICVPHLTTRVNLTLLLQHSAFSKFRLAHAMNCTYSAGSLLRQPVDEINKSISLVAGNNTEGKSNGEVVHMCHCVMRCCQSIRRCRCSSVL